MNHVGWCVQHEYPPEQPQPLFANQFPKWWYGKYANSNLCEWCVWSWGIFGASSEKTENFLRLSLARTHSCQASMCWCECRALIFRFKVATRAKIKPNNGNTNFHDYMLLNVQMFTCVCSMRLKWWGEKCEFSFTKWQFAEAMRYMRMHTVLWARTWCVCCRAICFCCYATRFHHLNEYIDITHVGPCVIK